MATESSDPRTRREFLRESSAAAAGLLSARLAFGQEPASAPRPNLIFILADDLGWTDLGCFGSTYYETPHIDRLCAQGLKFTDGYTCGPNCVPTRAALVTGLYGPRTGMYTVGTGARGQEQFRKMTPVDNVESLPKGIATVADALKAAGYATALFGKWHLGRDEYHPSQRGFQEAIVSMGRHFKVRTDPPVSVSPETYLADFLTDRAVDFIERNKARPFFLYLAHFAVHVPHEAKAELIAKFKDKPPVGGHRDPTYAAMIASLDESVGRVMAKLDELKLAENTLIVFSSDNGGVGGYQVIGNPKGGITDNAPLKGGKGMLYEGGVRVPFIVRWPRVARPGRVCAEPVNSVDLLPTFVEAAGGKPNPSQPLDGVSFLPLLRSAHATLSRDALYWHFPGYLEGGGPGRWRTTPAGSVRSGDWKLIEFFEDGRRELYNLRDDLGERKNLAPEKPDKAKEMHQRLIAWRKAVNAPMPSRKPSTTTSSTTRTILRGEEI